jgi:sRNA-binding carbon storage regulator CsrA
MDVLSFPPEEILVFRRKLHETFTISLSSEANPDTPVGEFFFEPIQIGVLKLTDKRVKLCVHAHEALEIRLDGFVDDAFIEHYKSDYV